MSDPKKPQIVFLTVDEMVALGVIAQSVIENGGKVQWKLPVSQEWLEDLKSANKKLDAKLKEIDGPNR